MITVNLPQLISICLLCFGTGILVATLIHNIIMSREDGERDEGRSRSENKDT
jgi:hypothetical protein